MRREESSPVEIKATSSPHRKPPPSPPFSLHAKIKQSTAAFLIRSPFCLFPIPLHNWALLYLMSYCVDFELSFNGEGKFVSLFPSYP